MEVERTHDVEKSPNEGAHAHDAHENTGSPFAMGLRQIHGGGAGHDQATSGQTTTSPRLYKPNTHPFLGRLGGNQEFVAEKDDHQGEGSPVKEPDAAPGMSLMDQLDLRGFARIGLWKAAIMEGMGTMLLVYVTIWANMSPGSIPTMPTAELGYFDNAAYLGPLTGGLINFILLTLFTFVFGVLTGAHLNPTITIGTFFARLTTLPRMVLYVAFQTFGATLAGYMVRAGYGSRDFKVGGCWLYTGGESQYGAEGNGVARAFSNEFMACLTLLFLAFGVGLDPRQQKIIPPALSPFLVGLVLGVLSWAFGYAVYGYGGASMNPARCFGAAVGSHFPGWHWYIWVAPICASIVHAVFYFLIPPGRSLFP